MYDIRATPEGDAQADLPRSRFPSGRGRGPTPLTPPDTWPVRQPTKVSSGSVKVLSLTRDNGRIPRVRDPAAGSEKGLVATSDPVALARLEQLAEQAGGGENLDALVARGVGKTMLAVGLAIAACQAGFSIYFTTLDHMVRQLREAETTGASPRSCRPTSSPRCSCSTRSATCPCADRRPTWSSSSSAAATSGAA